MTSYTSSETFFTDNKTNKIQNVLGVCLKDKSITESYVVINNVKCKLYAFEKNGRNIIIVTGYKKKLSLDVIVDKLFYKLDSRYYRRKNIPVQSKVISNCMIEYPYFENVKSFTGDKNIDQSLLCAASKDNIDNSDNSLNMYSTNKDPIHIVSIPMGFCYFDLACEDNKRYYIVDCCEPTIENMVVLNDNTEKNKDNSVYWKFNYDLDLDYCKNCMSNYVNQELFDVYEGESFEKKRGYLYDGIICDGCRIYANKLLQNVCHINNVKSRELKSVTLEDIKKMNLVFMSDFECKQILMSLQKSL